MSALRMHKIPLRDNKDSSGWDFFAVIKISEIHLLPTLAA